MITIGICVHNSYGVKNDDCPTVYLELSVRICERTCGEMGMSDWVSE